MINVKIKEILESDDRSIKYLSDKTGLNYSALYKLVNNQTESINFNTLETICNFLEVDISDVLEIVPDDLEQ